MLDAACRSLLLKRNFNSSCLCKHTCKHVKISTFRFSVLCVVKSCCGRHDGVFFLRLLFSISLSVKMEISMFLYE